MKKLNYLPEVVRLKYYKTAAPKTIGIKFPVEHVGYVGGLPEI